MRRTAAPNKAVRETRKRWSHPYYSKANGDKLQMILEFDPARSRVLPFRAGKDRVVTLVIIQYQCYYYLIPESGVTGFDGDIEVYGCIPGTM